MILSLFGQPGSGKSTLAKEISKKFPGSLIIDGDELRKTLSNENFSRTGREKNIRAANSIARFIAQKESRLVIMAIVNPFRALREELKTPPTIDVFEVCLMSERNLRRDFHCSEFEIGKPDLCVQTDEPIQDSVDRITKKMQIF